MTALVATIAVVAFTRFVPGFGQVHGDPESSLAEARKPKVPEDYVDLFVNEGLVELPDVGEPPAPPADEPPADDGGEPPAPPKGKAGKATKANEDAPPA